MKKLLLILFMLPCMSCASVTPPKSFEYKENISRDFTIVSWQKITDTSKPYKFYIEGDGYAFDKNGKASSDPTPKSKLVRRMAFGDKSPNVIYLARPGQFTKKGATAQKYWTTARFAPEVIDAEFDAVKNTAGNSPVILIGYSGGAQIAGLLTAAKSGLNVKKIITVAGNLDHAAWTKFHKLPPLSNSLNLKDYYNIYIGVPQINYAGAKDTVIPKELTLNFIAGKAPVKIVKKASHWKGFEEIYPQIWEVQ